MLTTKRVSVLTGYMVVSLMGTSLAKTYSSGPPPAMNGSTASGGSNCSVCHNNSAGGAGLVQIIGVPSAYMAGALYNLTVRVEDPAQVGAGYQFSVEDAGGTAIGTLATVDTNSQLNSGFINHTSTGETASISNWGSLGNAAEYQFTWQAPASDAGPLTFWVAGNAVNNAGGDTGDHVYLANQAVAFAGNIPTLSEWGLVIMLMLLLTAGTIIMLQPRSNAM